MRQTRRRAPQRGYECVMGGSGAVGEIQPGHVHPGPYHPCKGARRITGRSQGGGDLGPSFHRHAYTTARPGPGTGDHRLPQALLVHGGAWNIPDELVEPSLAGLRAALAVGRDGTVFGADRMADALCEHRDDSAEEIVAAIRDALTEFTGGAPPTDDCTALIVKRT